MIILIIKKNIYLSDIAHRINTGFSFDSGLDVVMFIANIVNL